MSTAFASALADREAEDYADFLLPHLEKDFRVLDAGCGSGTITLGLAGAAGHVVGIDLEDDFEGALLYAAQHEVENLEFRVGDVYTLDFPDDHFDACLCHSMLEMLDGPLDAVRELKRVLRPGGVLGVACVEYGGLVLAGPASEVLERFYAIRERVWLLEHAADPYRGRRLRGLLERAGFEDVAATSKYYSHGTPDAVKAFGLARAEDCSDPWYAGSAMKHGLATPEDLAAMSEAWRVWSTSTDAYAAFAWCRALGWKPSRASNSAP
jgi:ubiquinone/menaquinone biosynthesis C-methylase UbiE